MKQKEQKNVSNIPFLREARLEHHWSQQEVAGRLGTTTNNISRWELGQTFPGLYFRGKLCELFGKSAEALGLIERNAHPLPSPELTEATQTSSSSVDMLWTVPYLRNPHFTGRDELLASLTQHFLAKEQNDSFVPYRVALTQPQAIKGLGGIGKTQIAVEYAYRAREQGQYTHILWINAASEEAIITSFGELAELLPSFLEKDEKDQQQRVAAIKRWLERCKQRWLLIFDNADDLSLVQEYLPRQGNGSLLLTTRANAVSSLATPIDVGNMGLIEGTMFLLQRAQRQHASDEERNEASNLVIALDHFPLALDQAGAYIEETRCSFSTYLQLYQEHRQALLARRGSQSTGYPDSVATTWLLSFQKVARANPAAEELLKLCAFLPPDHIPEELLRQGVAYWPPLLQQATSDLFTFNQMIEDLLKLSLIGRLVENQMLSIHRLVQAVQMDRMEQDAQCLWAERVVRATNDLFPQDPEDPTTWQQCTRSLDLAQTCSHLIAQYTLTNAAAGDLLHRTATYFHDHGWYFIAEPLYQQGLQIRKLALGPEHPDIATSLNNLGELYRAQGKYGEAEPLYQQGLQIRELALRPEHPDIATSLNNLAELYRTQGRDQEAEPLYQQGLQIRELALGPEHPDVATSLNNLAILRWKQGRYSEAEPLLQRTLAIYTQTLGLEHRWTSAGLNNLAELYRIQGKYREAEPLCTQGLAIMERALGPEHPEVAPLLNNLARLYRMQGKYKEAEQLCKRALSIWEHQPGPECPDVGQTLNNLAELYREQQKYAEAEPLYQRALHILEQTLGPAHLQVTGPLNGLASLYREQEKYAEAEPLYQRALRILEQILGRQHITTAETLDGLAVLQAAQGNLQEAASLYQQALSARERVFGPDHPKTSETRNRLHELLAAPGPTVEMQPSNPTI